MSAVRLEAADLALLSRLTPDLDFSDAERQAALQENASRDFNAVPGSGKTSLIAAKLLLLAHKWPHANKGVCILSHTNVAREEIVRRLARTDEGARLLTYPHFIGTIHGFVNQFLALPALRAIGLPLDVIDDDVFETRALARLKGNQYYKLRAWLSHQANGDSLVGRLYYKGAALELASDAGSLPGLASDSGKQLAAIKLGLTQAGVFRHRDMFAFASAALDSHPGLLDVIHRRFPMVFVDEMQDTSWEQESILNRLFDGRSVMQRFGDVDQKIILNDDEAAKVTFPRTGHGTVSSSKRFGPRIAAAVASVRLSKLPVNGEGPDDISPVLLLYKTEDVGRVVRRFGKLVAERFDADALRDKSVRAMCTRKAVEGAVDAGRHLGDYWPSYAQLNSGVTAGSDGGFWRLVGQGFTQRSPATLGDPTGDARNAILLVLRAAKAPVTSEVRDARALPRAVAELHGNAAGLQALIRDLVLDPTLLGTPEARQALPGVLYLRLGQLLPDSMTLTVFVALNVFAQPAAATATPTLEPPALCVYDHGGRELKFPLGTVAGMKGETHLASLVLESYGGRSKKFDLELALPAIAGLGKGLGKLGPLQQGQMRNVYVAMSRPTRFLCLAANASRVAEETRAALVTKGWQLELLS
jgi:DNA helicase-2/ATP-dependent DNA helicase PcrA